MKSKIRTYDTLRLLRGERKNHILVQLADLKKDFEYRRLLIEEREIDLHVYFSRMKTSEWISWGLILLSLVSIQIPQLSVTLFLFSIVFRILMFSFRKKLQKTFQKYMFSLMIVDSVIKNDYGIVLT